MTTSDIIVGLQYGDEGKGKVAHSLLGTGKYTHCVRYNGGCNAGHTIYHKGKKFVTHHLPAGIFYGIKSIIGPGCVLNPTKFFEELKNFEKTFGQPIDHLVKVASNVHVITAEHLEEDGKDETIGTTKSGNGPAYRDKYSRAGTRAADVAELSDYVVDFYKEIYENKEEVNILFEGAQGFGLDIDWGDYPYVTSSHCTSVGAVLNGVPLKSVRDVWGIAKAYETYVGKKNYQPADKVFDIIQEVGQEFGATTGRVRQCNWMDMMLLTKSININGANKIVINKMDVLDEIEEWGARIGEETRTFDTRQEFMSFVGKYLEENVKHNIEEIYYSCSPQTL